ncbi:MAG: pyuvate ferredoxin oxidoreductase subunit delta [Pelotomaculum sp. PtaU1.Bin035]|nr:MAG: pyuvate ferredoxin oxidoreductase subunit delta [Pelotomaculum sp. PtaU1.Bin035]
MASKKIILRFGKDISDKPIIFHLARDYNLVFNIIKANVNPNKEGTVVMELTGEKYDEGLDFLKSQGVRVQPLAEEVFRNRVKCTSCGACTTICPTGALYLERPSMEVMFDSDNCVLCQICLKVCPVKAMEVRF